MLNLIKAIELENKSMSPRMKRDMSNWIKVADKIYKNADEQDLLEMMVFESKHKNRGYVIERLHSRYNALRVKREKKELKEWRKNLKSQKRK